jgi:hypothetical protein
MTPSKPKPPTSSFATSAILGTIFVTLPAYRTSTSAKTSLGRICRYRSRMPYHAKLKGWQGPKNHWECTCVPISVAVLEKIAPMLPLANAITIASKQFVITATGVQRQSQSTIWFTACSPAILSPTVTPAAFIAAVTLLTLSFSCLHV